VDWARDGAGWPNAAHSRLVDCPPHRWHLQDAGTGPVVVLLHGAGASAHSWRQVLPLLAARFRVLAVDLPGQGFSRCGSRARLTPEAIAADLARLLAAEAPAPSALVGHSAGAAVALRLAAALPAPPAALVGINPALAAFRGVAGWLLPVLARAMALNPLTAPLLARGASPETVRGIIASTGSRLDAEGLDLYRRLMADRAHVEGTLAMMAGWRLEGLAADLPLIAVPALFLAGGRDRAVPPATVAAAAARMPQAELRLFPELGHLLHEEAPAVAAAAIAGFLGPRLPAPAPTVPVQRAGAMPGRGAAAADDPPPAQSATRPERSEDRKDCAQERKPEQAT